VLPISLIVINKTIAEVSFSLDLAQLDSRLRPQSAAQEAPPQEDEVSQVRKTLGQIRERHAGE